MVRVPLGTLDLGFSASPTATPIYIDVNQRLGCINELAYKLDANIGIYCIH